MSMSMSMYIYMYVHGVSECVCACVCECVCACVRVCVYTEIDIFDICVYFWIRHGFLPLLTWPPYTPRFGLININTMYIRAIMYIQHTCILKCYALHASIQTKHRTVLTCRACIDAATGHSAPHHGLQADAKTIGWETQGARIIEVMIATKRYNGQ